MTDPERISRRSSGLAAELLLAGADEQPGDAGMQRTLAALGVSAVVATSAGTASAAAGGVKAASTWGATGAGVGAVATGGTVKAVTATLLAKWVGLGVVGGIGLAGVAAVATAPASRSGSLAASHTPASARASASSAPAAPRLAPPSPAVPEAPLVEAAPVPAPASARVGASEHPAPAALEVGAPLAAEVSYVDRARALLAGGQVEQGLELLQGYDRKFPEARLLPEVLFLRLETCERLGRRGEARAAAQRLLEGFPKSPHASRARQVMAEE